MPSRERLRRDPDREAAALLQRPVVLWPVADLVARPRDLVAARLIGFVGHRASGKRGSGPIRSTLPQPKPKARNFAPTPFAATSGSRRHPTPTVRMWPSRYDSADLVFNAPRPRKRALGPSSSSIRSSWLYFASRSERDSEPVLICPQFVATARSAMVASSVSPERCDITHAYPARWAVSTASSVSVRVPI